MVRRAALVLVACLLLLPVGCATAPGSDAWGAGAVSRLRAEAAALSSGDAYLPLSFWAADVDVDLKVAVPSYAERFPRARGLDRAVLLFEGTRIRASVEQVYLDQSGAFTQERWEEPGRATVGALRDVGVSGVESLRGFLHLVDRGDAFDYRRRDLLARLTPLVTAYEAAWATGDAPALSDLYAPGAVVSQAGHDEPWSVSLGRRGPQALSSGGDQPPGAALYAYAPLGQAPQQAVVLFDLARPGGCAVHVAQLWTLEAGRIARDRRLLEASSASRCLPAAERPSGWWAHLSPPVPPERRLTGTEVIAGGGVVGLYNATPNLARLLDWGIGQFAAAGMAIPRPAAAVFAPARACASAAGGVVEVPAGFSVTVCYSEATACESAACSSFSEGARMFMLHELGHVWALQHLDARAETAFDAAAGLPGWIGSDIPYAERGAEHAAETIAWGLLGEVHDRYRNLTKPPCAAVAERFVLLTGVAPLSSCPP